jgi:hypothetical protein
VLVFNDPPVRFPAMAIFLSANVRHYIEPLELASVAGGSSRTSTRPTLTIESTTRAPASA